jgi:8-oxo-dGTP pyrophosphatase MutT (NUDIX family)
VTGLLTLIRADQPPPPTVAPAGYVLRACSPADIEALGDLYFASYDPGEAAATREEAVADIRAAFAGDYGELWPEASLVATTPAGDLAAAIQVVRRAPWPDTPDCPFVIELFTARAHRRRGLARALIAGALAVVGRTEVALRVSAGNDAALALYRDLGFSDRRPPERIVAAVLRDGDRILLCHRSPDRRWYPDVWDLPGGHADDGESPGAALVRELREELGIVVGEPSGPPLREVRTDAFHLRIWLIVTWTGTPANSAPDEHDAIGWFDRSQLAGLRLAHDSYLETFTDVLTKRSER